MSDVCERLISGRTAAKNQEVHRGILFDELFGYFNLRDLEQNVSIAPAQQIPSLTQRVIHRPSTPDSSPRFRQSPQGRPRYRRAEETVIRRDSGLWESWRLWFSRVLGETTHCCF
jgi:hypothetical protein